MPVVIPQQALLVSSDQRYVLHPYSPTARSARIDVPRYGQREFLRISSPACNLHTNLCLGVAFRGTCEALQYQLWNSLSIP